MCMQRINNNGLLYKKLLIFFLHKVDSQLSVAIVRDSVLIIGVTEGVIEGIAGSVTKGAISDRTNNDCGTSFVIGTNK